MNTTHPIEAAIQKLDEALARREIAELLKKRREAERAAQRKAHDQEIASQIPNLPW